MHTGPGTNEKADESAKAAAEGGEPDNAVPDEYRREASLSYMTRVATEARSQETARWARDHVGPQRRHRLPPGKGVRRRLRRARKSVASRYYQLLSRDAAIGPY